MAKIYPAHSRRAIHGGCYAGTTVLRETMCVCSWSGDCTREWWMEDGRHKEMEIAMKKEIRRQYRPSNSFAAGWN